MKNNFTSQPLSKLLFDNGFNGRFDYVWRDCPFTKKPKLVWVDWGNEEFPLATDLPAYGILNDICIKYCEEFWGEEVESKEWSEYLGESVTNWDLHMMHIWKLLRKGKKQEAEDYIFKHCLFNPKNK